MIAMRTPHPLTIRSLLAVSLILGASDARATQTDPVLEILAAYAVTSTAGTTLQLDASFPAADLVEKSAFVHVLVRDLSGAGTRYARFALGGTAVGGDAPALADGLDPADVAGLLASGSPLAGARVLQISPGRIEVWLPADFALGAAEVSLFVVYEGDPLLSNPAGVTP
jgi:hypothetical protein